jgi:DNA-binding NarL/FixJ family response regulator
VTAIIGRTMFVPSPKLQQERKRLIHLWLEGEPIGVIAQEIQISKDAVKKRRKRLNLPARRHLAE